MLALIAGTGALPAAVVAGSRTRVLVCAYQGHLPQGLAVDLTFRLETLGTLLADLRGRGVQEVCFAGAIARPRLDPGALDAATLPMVPIFQRALALGDDGALRAVIAIFEEAGFVVRAAHDLVPDLLLAAGVATQAAPGLIHRADVQEALLALAEMGQADLGQACVVREGAVIAREAADGTDAMLGRLADPAFRAPEAGDPLSWAFDTAGDLLQGAADWLSGSRVQAPGGLLFKAPKPGQDRRIDLPTIGPGTAMRAVEAGLDGIVIEAGGVIVLDPSQVLAILDGAGLFLWVRPA